ncbi:ABC transporter permease [Streptomyces sp. NPDC006134]|uniref:ABC transporter permease n=1 Tax=Streptomyces sp. NPDC006134 TaxID=3154467 RepID=UPI0033F07E3B
MSSPAVTPPRKAAPASAASRAVVHKELLLNRRDPLLLVMMFVFPIVLVALLSSALGGAFALGDPPDYVLVGRQSTAVAQRLGEPESVVSLDEARRRIGAGEVSFAVVTGDDGEVRQLIADPATRILLPTMLAAIEGKAPDVVGPDGKPYSSGASPYAATLLGFVIYHAFFAASHAAQSVHRERTWGTWNRMLTLGLGKGWLLTAKMIPTVLVVTLQGLLLVGGGCLVLGIPVHSPLGLAAGCLLAGLCVAGVGAMLAAVSRNDAQVPQLNNLLVLVGGTLGGSLVPLAIMPSWVRAVAPLTPQYWLVELFKGATSRGAAAADMAFEGLMVLLFCAVLFGVGVAAMRWDRFRHA